MGEELDSGGRRKSGGSAKQGRPIADTRLVREYQGVAHVVTVTSDGFEWQVRPCKSLSAITGVRWNGRVFLGPKGQKRPA